MKYRMLCVEDDSQIREIIEDYFTAKKNIFHYQHSNDLLIFGDIFQHTHHEEIDALPMKKIDLIQNHIVDFNKIIW